MRQVVHDFLVKMYSGPTEHHYDHDVQDDSRSSAHACDWAARPRSLVAYRSNQRAPGVLAQEFANALERVHRLGGVLKPLCASWVKNPILRFEFIGV